MVLKSSILLFMWAMLGLGIAFVFIKKYDVKSFVIGALYGQFYMFICFLIYNYCN